MQVTLNSKLVIVRFGEDGKLTKESLLELFFDADFTENVEQYREDTLEKGFVSEAERVIEETLETYDQPIDIIHECVEAQTESDFYVAVEVNTHTVDEEYIVVSIAYTTN